MTTKPHLDVLLAAPRGFCAGVDRAIQIVEMAIEKFGAPVYVRHEIVHNRTVVESLEAKGAVFVEELSEVPNTDAPVISRLMAFRNRSRRKRRSGNSSISTRPARSCRRFTWRPSAISKLDSISS